MEKKNTKIIVSSVAIFFATMLVLHLLTSVIFYILPVLPIKPTITHVPVIIASIVYGPIIGGILGSLMGILSIISNTFFLLPTSYLFSPFIPNGNINSFIVSMVPRILIGITPHFIYKLLKSKFGLALAGMIGSITNTIFVLGGIFFLFKHIYEGNIQVFLTGVISTNSISEMLISSILTVKIVPVLERIRKYKKS